MALLDSVEAKTPRGEFLRSLAVGVIVAGLGAIGAGLTTFWTISASHMQTEDHLITIDTNITDVKRNVEDVKGEQGKVRAELGTQHDELHDSQASIKAITNDIIAGRAQTHARLDALEAKFIAIGEALAVIKQVVTDNKESQVELKSELKSHSDDLAAIRDKLGASRH